MMIYEGRAAAFLPQTNPNDGIIISERILAIIRKLNQLFNEFIKHNRSFKVIIVN